MANISADRDFRVRYTITNTGAIRATYWALVGVAGPVTYERLPPSVTLDPGQSIAQDADFLRTAFEIGAWAPGTYNIDVTLYDAATNRLLDEVFLPGELVVSVVAPPPTGGQIASVSAPASVAAGQPLTVQVAWSAGVRAYITVALMEPPGYSDYVSFTSTPVLDPGSYSQGLTFTVQPGNAVGANRLRVDLVSEAGAYLAEQVRDIEVTGPTGAPGRSAEVSVAAL